MPIIDDLKRRTVGLLAEPRVFRALQGDRVSRALGRALDVSGSLGAAMRDQGDRIVHALGLARQREVERLDQRVAELEAQLEAARKPRG